MRILGIESSCDETSAAVVEDGRVVRSNIIATSRLAFERAGGVIPEKAARETVRCAIPVVEQALNEAQCTPDDIDAVAVTAGPGLLGSLLVGTATARCIAQAWNKPLIGVHHTLGHLSSTWLLKQGEPQGEDPRFPVMTLSVSGGHTELWLRTSHTKGFLVGRTRDDAAGEAFDKGATLLGLPYPGGPSIAKAADGRNESFLSLPRPLKGDDSCDFSFSGLKTALRYALAENPTMPVGDAAASFQHAICLHLLDRLEHALRKQAAVEVHVVGGVSANARLRQMLGEHFPTRTVRVPITLGYCTDNAAMIASAAYYLVRERPSALTDPVVAAASMPLESAVAPA